MIGRKFILRAALAAGFATVATAGSVSVAQEVIDPAARQAQAASKGVQTTATKAIGVRQTKHDKASGSQPLDRLVTRVENRVRSRVENRIDRDYDPQADSAASFAEANRRSREVGPARRRR